MIGMLMRAFECRDSNNWRHLYVSLVRPHLEYAVRLELFLKSYIEKLEKVQERLIIPYGFNGLSYEERLKRMNFKTLNDIL